METIGDSGKVRSGTSANENCVYVTQYVNHGLEEVYLNGGQFGVKVSWRDGGENHEESIYFEEVDEIEN
ncbi:hypothetical protein [Alkalicoccobacillus plakortidis]|uniref:Uncharacterized protein n=1 Tax=Alkalicoccobacillus plakortidis TaxID=444060 RepID=A0ABT0XNA3_9BACI|nr:hypothetical protein [Alkalicoccobacillus plakortidis]MCM2677386.1 hypothetical protein [Alkalicoccobacillus plakortidis]